MTSKRTHRRSAPSLSPSREAETRRFERRLPHSPEDVWRALTEPGELAHWFPCAVEGELVKGAPLRFVFDDEPSLGGTITECEPPNVLAYTMGEETVRWELTAVPEGCVLVLTTEVGAGASVANDTTCTRVAA